MKDRNYLDEQYQMHNGRPMQEITVKLCVIVIALFLYGCGSMSTELTVAESELHIYHEEPNTSYEDLGQIIAASRYNHAEESVKKLMRTAVGMGADAVIIHRRGNRDGAYRIEATAIRYVD